MHQGLVAGDAADEEPAVGAIGQSRQVQPFQLGKIGADDLGLDGLAVPGLAQGQAGEIVGVDGAVVAKAVAQLGRVDRDLVHGQQRGKGDQAGVIGGGDVGRVGFGRVWLGRGGGVGGVQRHWGNSAAGLGRLALSVR